MKTTLIGAVVCAAISSASIHAADSATIAVAPTAASFVSAQTPTLTRVWWAGPTTVCHLGYYGERCHLAYARPFIPGHYDWRGFWIPGHWA